MQRRTFLAMNLASVALYTRMPWAESLSSVGGPKIADVQVWRLQGTRESLQGAHRQYQVKPLYIYDKERPEPYAEPPNPKTATVGTSAYYVKITTDQDVEGLYGPIDREAAIVVDLQLAGFLRGRDALAVELLWDQMYRLNRHSRAGHFMMGISAVDNALWDLRGRYFDAPVYQLLGGPTRTSVEAYASCLGYSVEPERARLQSVAFRDEGFRHQKWFIPYGPGSGTQGLQENVALVRNLREAAGSDVELMFDAFMGWDLRHAVSWVKQVESLRPRWIEEAFPPDRIESFARLRAASSIPVATGEHFYSRWEVQKFLDAGAIDVIQADPEWCGGVSELMKICTLASAHEVQVVPHGHALHAALHVVASQSPMTCPLVEFLFNKMAHWHHFEKYPPQRQGAMITLPTRPGFGIEWDDEKIQQREHVRWS
jgi:L-alanine-DL-glutamate epimerase-like enolase superfamily enzyme